MAVDSPLPTTPDCTKTDTRGRFTFTTGAFIFTIVRAVCLAYLPDIDVGEYAIVHAGFAISQVDEEAALESIRLFREMGGHDQSSGGTTLDG